MTQTKSRLHCVVSDCFCGHQVQRRTSESRAAQAACTASSDTSARPPPALAAQTLGQLKSKSAHKELSCAWLIGQLFTKNQSVDVDLQNDENLFFCNEKLREHQNSEFHFGFNVGYITLTCSSPPVPLRAPQPGLSIRGVIWILASCQTPPIFTNTETAI